MTIFLKVVKQKVNEVLTSLYNSSIELDESWFNRAAEGLTALLQRYVVMSDSAIARDRALTDKERQILNELNDSIQELKDSENDARTLGALQVKIQEAQDKARALKTDPHAEKTELENNIFHLNNLVQAIYDKLNTVKHGEEPLLIGYQDDSKPFNTYRKAVAAYLSTKLTDAYFSKTYLIHALEHKTISDAKIIAETKEKILLQEFQTFVAAIKEEKIDENSPIMPFLVTRSLAFAQRQNTELCASKTVRIPLFVVGEFQRQIYKPGDLQEYLERAINKITNPPPIEQSAAADFEDLTNSEELLEAQEDERKRTEEAAIQEAEKKRAEEAAIQEAERKRAEEAAIQEAERKRIEEAAIQEAERKRTEEAAIQEAEKKRAEEAAIQEAERKRAEEAAAQLQHAIADAEEGNSSTTTKRSSIDASTTSPPASSPARLAATLGVTNTAKAPNSIGKKGKGQKGTENKDGQKSTTLPLTGIKLG